MRRAGQRIPAPSWQLSLALTAGRVAYRLGRSLTADEWERLKHARFGRDPLESRRLVERHRLGFRLRRVGNELKLLQVQP